ncbi:unnamed protein product [Angiostrongylus costaricensis]|uniref:MICOS complex subunit MIC13 n=1 Tax=Angiostrongylus costaricensis TaxID=334426 RepID=A0A0R3PCA9_ANGCS|nr:unnamed protein product [Angiostrongylus costaricensis]
MGFLWSLFSIKVALVAGAVKLSIDSDVWSLDNENGANLYNNVKRYILPGTVVFPKKIPSIDEVQLDVAQCWNNGIDRVSAVNKTAKIVIINKASV